VIVVTRNEYGLDSEAAQLGEKMKHQTFCFGGGCERVKQVSRDQYTLNFFSEGDLKNFGEGLFVFG
jgi:hypothetical protein